MQQLKRSKRRHHWFYRCQCGNVFEAYLYNVTSGHTRSCGCLVRGKQITKSPAYKCWKNMRSRCQNPRATGYELYGGRGVTVCSRWEDFETFSADMGERPSKRHSLDRIDVNGNYEPGNVRWVLQITQANNKRFNHIVKVNGVEGTISQVARVIGVKPNTLYYRIKRGSKRDYVARRKAKKCTTIVSNLPKKNQV